MPLLFSVVLCGLDDEYFGAIASGAADDFVVIDVAGQVIVLMRYRAIDQDLCRQVSAQILLGARRGPHEPASCRTSEIAAGVLASHHVSDVVAITHQAHSGRGAVNVYLRAVRPFLGELFKDMVY